MLTRTLLLAHRALPRSQTPASTASLSSLTQHTRALPTASPLTHRRSASTLTAIHSDDAPAAVGAYSQAIAANGFIYLSGALGLDPKTGNFVDDKDVVKQTHQAMKNIEAILKAGNSDLTRVVKTTILLADINDFSKVNEAYSSYFSTTKPARACYAVRDLPKAARVEIEAIAVAK